MAKKSKNGLLRIGETMRKTFAREDSNETKRLEAEAQNENEKVMKMKRKPKDTAYMHHRDRDPAEVVTKVVATNIVNKLKAHTNEWATKKILSGAQKNIQEICR